MQQNTPFSLQFFSTIYKKKYVQILNLPLSLTHPGFAEFCCVWFEPSTPHSTLPEPSTPAPSQMLPENNNTCK